ncbi:MAG TPA: TetR/AcrR family transcriptional regulator [Ktedonobacterales bacterium]|nr:TetR/AcrR family transcriptional regulator [Ktedonobacterales bacterium]
MANQAEPQDGGARTHERVRDKEATRQRLLDAAEAVFADKGYHGAAVDDITRISDSSKGGFYFHFPNKEAIFLALVDSLTPRLEAAIERAISAESDPVTQLDAALRTVFETFSSHRRLSKILLVEAVGLGHGFDEKLMLVRGRFAAMIQRRLDLAVQSGRIPPVDTETVAWAWFGAINEIVTRWLVSGQPRRLDDAFPALRALLLRSIGALSEDTPQALRKEDQA